MAPPNLGKHGHTRTSSQLSRRDNSRERPRLCQRSRVGLQRGHTNHMEVWLEAPADVLGQTAQHVWIVGDDGDRRLIGHERPLRLAMNQAG